MRFLCLGWHVGFGPASQCFVSAGTEEMKILSCLLSGNVAAGWNLFQTER